MTIICNYSFFQAHVAGPALWQSADKRGVQLSVAYVIALLLCVI